jgi:hypothetical protein
MFDPVCGGWLSCFQICTTPACYDGCDAQFPGAAALYKPIYGCICAGCWQGLCDPGTGACGK